MTTHPEWSPMPDTLPGDTDVGYMLQNYLPLVIERLESCALALERIASALEVHEP